MDTQEKVLEGRVFEPIASVNDRLARGGLLPSQVGEAYVLYGWPFREIFPTPAAAKLERAARE